ncbi:alpha/beta hydrolase [Nesterenkonia massiliensis]|uniref:Alpha/beta hydrolase n=1 Tax=Nesterenkonia massiliensis TaxID=1232429 RepID=A0ABT2HQ92_9MICC|nr:alpha/beta fold hydrolase [Nesterenkonia massiliensis]MCT1606865.1 alpha/beta hydrolase [Nesterenkonia massiliensis]
MVTMKSRKIWVWLAVSLVLMLTSAMGASFVQTSGGDVEVKDLQWETSQGVSMSGLLLVPEGASAEAPAPGIVVSHGMYNNREMQEANYVELSRRGYVVLSMDMYSHGWSEPVADIGTLTTGMYQAVSKISTLDYVDTDRIGITGHSLGGMSSNVAVQLDNEFGTDLISAVLINSADAVYSDPETAEFVNIYGSRDVGIIAPQYDEFFFDDVDDQGQTTAARDFIDYSNAQSFLHFGTDPGQDRREPGEFYTQDVDGEEALRIIHNPAITHAWSHFSHQATESTIEFFDEALGAPEPVPAGQQVWQWKAAFNALGLIGFGIFVVSVTLVLVRSTFFRSLAVAEPVRIRHADRAGKVWFWTTLTAAAIFAGVSYLPILTSVDSFTVAGGGWAQSSPYGIGMWAAANGLFILLMLALFYTFYIRPRGVSLADRGLTLTLAGGGKTVLLALTVVGASFLTVFLTDYFFKTDFRLWTLAVKPFPVETFWTALFPTLPLLLIYFVAASVAANAINFVQIGRRKLEGEWVNTTVLAVFSVLPVVAVLLVQYTGFFTTGFLPFGDANMQTVWLYTFLVILPVTTVISRKIYRETNNPYLPGLINGLLVTLIASSNTLTWA